MEEQNNEPIDALEDTPPDEDFKTKIEEIYHDLPLSIKTEYQERLKKHNLKNDFETEKSYKILERLNKAYERKRERSRKNSQIKRDTMKALSTKLNIEQKPRGSPEKVTPLPEPKEPPPPLQKEEELPEPELELQFEMDEDEDNDDINEILKDVKFEPKKEYKPLDRSTFASSFSTSKTFIKFIIFLKFIVQ
jgi:hypothetical protein